ncbi:MAG: hypothetical protein M0Q91_06585 [Methanoregula sp.]|jgi:hypothetical protein|nr:hypothetical protein [Methanoregula sp.]
MTRGCRPLKAIVEAEQIALERGAVHLTPCGRTNPFDLIIFEEHRVVFVRVKRSVSHFTNPFEILYQYRRDAGRLHRVPLTAVTARELWVRTPRGKWQFFLVRHDSIFEVQRDGTVIPHVALPISITENVVQYTSPDAEIVGDLTSDDV